MSILLNFIKASSFKDIPKVAQDCFENEDEFMEKWVHLQPYEKTENINMYLLDALEESIPTDKDFIRYIALSVVGSSHLYKKTTDTDDSESESEDEVVTPPVKQEVVVPMMEDTTELVKLKEENTRLKQQLANTIDPNEPTTARGRGRPAKNSLGGFRCMLCGVGMSSSGSLHNHYKSKPHLHKILDVLEKSKQYVEKDDMTTKIVVRTCNQSKDKDPNLTTIDPDKTCLDDIKAYAKSGYNPISDIILFQQITEVSQVTGREKLSWKKLC